MVPGRVSVIVLNWNGATLLESCLGSVKSQDYSDIELILIDNASSDGSQNILKEHATNQIILNDINIGFSPAMNKGIECTTGEFVMPLNYDTVLEPDFVRLMLAPALADERVGSVTGKLLRLDDNGNKSNIIDSTGHILFVNRLAVNRGENEVDAGRYDESGEVFGACGAAPLYRRAMLEDIKVDGEYYDEDFFAFWEDVDIDWRARLRGWRCMYEPKAVAYHERGGPKKRRSKTVEYHNYKNRYLMMMKNDDPSSLARIMPQMILTEKLKFLALLVRCPSAIGGLAKAIKMRKRMMKKRAIIQSGRTVDQLEFEKWLSPFDYRSWIMKNLFGR